MVVKHTPIRAGTRHGTDVKEGTNVGLKNGSKCVQELVLVMGVDLLILLVEAEDDLPGTIAFSQPFILFDRVTETVEGRKIAEKSCVVRRTSGSELIYMRRHLLPVDDIPKTVADNVDDYFLTALLTLRLAAITHRLIGNIFHDTPHDRCK